MDHKSTPPGGSIRIGISGWSYPEWKGIFYPAELKSTDWLTFYTQSFDTTEVSFPNAQTILNWFGKVSPSFRFCLKVNKHLSHIQKLKEAEEPLLRLFTLFRPLQKQLGPISIQLPRSLKFDQEAVKDFLELLKHSYSEYEFALEAGHDSWLTKESADMLAHYNIAWVISQSGAGFPDMEQITTTNIYFRFHGPDELYASSYNDELLQTFAQQVKKWSDDGHNIWIYFNNCYSGYAINNALTLRNMIGELFVQK